MSSMSAPRMNLHKPTKKRLSQPPTAENTPSPALSARSANQLRPATSAGTNAISVANMNDTSAIKLRINHKPGPPNLVTSAAVEAWAK